jgi:NADH dehydrogenase [ubiquinone] 1 alpha subcomplex assembly factor 3
MLRLNSTVKVLNRSWASSSFVLPCRYFLHSSPSFGAKPFKPVPIPSGERPKINQTPRAAKGDLSDNDIYGDLEPPLNNVNILTKNGFVLQSGVEITSNTKTNPTALALLGTEAFKIDLTNAVDGLDKGIVEIDPRSLGLFEVVYPKPEILVVGLGAKSRVLGPKTSDYIRSLGIQVQLSTTEFGASNFDLLATERPGQVGALLFPPDM